MDAEDMHGAGGKPRRWIVLVAGTLLGSVLTLVAQQPPASVMKSTVWDWTKLEAKPTKAGAVRTVVRRPTPTLAELEIHITTLNPGEISHPPHQHPEEELLIVKEGIVDTSQNGVVTRLGPGSIIFQASNEMHNIANAGSTPATYHVIQWRVPAKEPAK